MFKKSGNTLHITRGDGGVLTLQYPGHTFSTGDNVVVNIYRENAMDTDPIMYWTTEADISGHSCEASFDGDTVEMTIEAEYTQLDSPITEPAPYWWEAVCGEETFICYDEQGPKILNLYPGGTN